MSRSVLLLAGITAGSLFLLGLTPQASTLMSAEPPPAKKAVLIPAQSTGMPTATAELKILRALFEPAKLDFVEEPLAGVIRQFSKEHKIEIVLDIHGLDMVDVGAKEPITLSVSGVSLRSALDLLLRNLDLTWTIDSEVLLITSLDKAEYRLTTKTYDVADLIVCQDEDGRLWDDYDSLTDTITATIAPETWSENEGGPGSIEGCGFGFAKVLVIRQTVQAHVEVAQLLDAIRKVIATHGTDSEPPVRQQSPTVCPNCRMSGGCIFGGMGGGMMGGMDGGGVIGGGGIGVWPW